MTRAAWMSAVGVVAVGAVGAALWAGQQAAPPNARLNPIIERHEQGLPAFGTHWRFLDMEHGGMYYDALSAFLARNKPEGATRPEVAPIVRIPYEGDQDFKHEVKRILDMGVYGIILPHTETAEQAAELVRVMRYPQITGSTYFEPNGVRGWNVGRASRYWGLPSPEYEKKADLWPLNPEGELLAIPMIETALGVQNVEAIAGVPGVGGPFMGFSDLGMDMGYGPPVVRTEAQVAEIEEIMTMVGGVCTAHKLICINVTDPGLSLRVEQGYNTFMSPPPSTDD